MTIRKKGFQFKPFLPTDRHALTLHQTNHSPHAELLVFERGNERRTLLVTEMSYHHIAQGELAGEPYLVSF